MILPNVGGGGRDYWETVHVDMREPANVTWYSRVSIYRYK